MAVSLCMVSVVTSTIVTRVLVTKDAFRINIAISYMHRLTARILDVSNSFQNTNVTINERVCVSPPPYYLNWFERSYPNVPLNRDDGPFVFSV